MTEETTRAFLLRLWELQAARGMSNAEMSRRLGISQSYVRRLKTRPRIVRLGFHIALAAVHEFPELALFLGLDLPGRQESAIISKPEEGAAHGG